MPSLSQCSWFYLNCINDIWTLRNDVALLGLGYFNCCTPSVWLEVQYNYQRGAMQCNQTGVCEKRIIQPLKGRVTSTGADNNLWVYPKCVSQHFPFQNLSKFQKPVRNPRSYYRTSALTPRYLKMLMGSGAHMRIGGSEWWKPQSKSEVVRLCRAEVTPSSCRHDNGHAHPKMSGVQSHPKFISVWKNTLALFLHRRNSHDEHPTTCHKHAQTEELPPSPIP